MSARPPSPALSGVALAPGLYLVATPIGNLRDITLRALDVLAGVDLVLAEDTRVTGKLLATYGISKPLERYNDHAGERVRPRVLAALASGGRIALCSDAGTPLVSDPGYRLVVAAVAAGHAVIPDSGRLGGAGGGRAPAGLLHRPVSCSPASRRPKRSPGAPFSSPWRRCAPPWCCSRALHGFAPASPTWPPSSGRARRWWRAS